MYSIGTKNRYNLTIQCNSSNYLCQQQKNINLVELLSDVYALTEFHEHCFIRNFKYLILLSFRVSLNKFEFHVRHYYYLVNNFVSGNEECSSYLVLVCSCHTESYYSFLESEKKNYNYWQETRVITKQNVQRDGFRSVFSCLQPLVTIVTGFKH